MSRQFWRCNTREKVADSRRGKEDAGRLAGSKKGRLRLIASRRAAARKPLWAPGRREPSLAIIPFSGEQQPAPSGAAPSEAASQESLSSSSTGPVPPGSLWPWAHYLQSTAKNRSSLPQPHRDALAGKLHRRLPCSRPLGLHHCFSWPMQQEMSCQPIPQSRGPQLLVRGLSGKQPQSLQGS